MIGSGTFIVVVAFVVIAVSGILAAWWLGSRMKRRLDGPTHLVSATREVIQLRPGVAGALRHLTSEPILLKKTEEGLRFQIDQRPMAPIAALAGHPMGGAVAEAAAAVTQRFGERWVALVQPSGDDMITVQRLA